MTVMTKSAFARHRGRSASAVNQWIKAGLIGREALVGEGRGAQIDVELAEKHLAARLDAGQALGNGAKGKRASEPQPQPKRLPQKLVEARALELEPELPGADDAGSPEYQAERARLVRAQRIAQERKNAVEAGDLVSSSERERVWGAIISGARSIILAVPGRVRDRHPELTATQIKSFDAELRAALTELGSGKFLE